MFPEGTPTVTLTGTLPGAAVGTPFTGRVVLTPSAELIDTTRHAIYPGGGRVDFANDGTFTVVLIPNNASGILPVGWKWQVDVQPLRGRRIIFWTDIHGADGATIHLDSLVPVPAPGGGPGPGPAGESAYEVAVDEGFDGTVSEWLASLTGPAGVDGSDGADGQDGATGTQGPQGTQGAVGPTGSAGPKGDQGDGGPEGPQGDPGPKGDTGDTGPQGGTGPQGETGATGPQPPLGAAGAGAAIALRSNDPTTTNSRTPTAHASTHAGGGTDPVALTQAQIAGLTAALAGLAPLAGAHFTGTVVVDDAAFSVLGTGKGYRFRPLGSRLDCEATGSDWMFSVFSGGNFDGTQRTYLRLEAGVQLAHAIGKWEFSATPDSGAVHTLDGEAGTAGFFGAAPVTQPTVTGSWADGTAGASLAAALDQLGLINDTTTP